MIILEKDKIIKFKKRLYLRKVPLILRSDESMLNVSDNNKADKTGKIIVLTNDIISFFFRIHQVNDEVDAGQYLKNLYLLLKILTEGSEYHSFQSDIMILENDIQEANNGIKIEYLTKNIIINYFRNIIMYNGLVDEALLDINLETIIKKSNGSRDTQSIINKAFEDLVGILKKGKPWKQGLKEIQKAELVCKLVGIQLPQIEKSILSGLVIESRAEIQQSISLLTKSLNTQEQLNQREVTHKNYLKVMNKIDLAINESLEKIEAVLYHAQKFMAIIDLSPSGFLSRNNEYLKWDIARLFFEYRDGDSERGHLIYSMSRHRIAKLFKYPEICKFSRALQDDEKYKGCFIKHFKIFFNELILQMNHLSTKDKDKDFKNCLLESVGLVEKLDLKKTALIPEKNKLKKTYLSLLKSISLKNITPLLDVKEDICRVIQDDSKEILEDIRKQLIQVCYERILGIDIDKISEESLCSSIHKLITGYSMHHKPQRFFFQNFFEKYIGSQNGVISNCLDQLIKTKKPLALAMLNNFSNEKLVGDLLPETLIEYSGILLKEHGL